MEERLPGFDQQIKLHVTGCTNSCGQHWIADIGLEGKKLKKDGVLSDAFYFCVGGAVGKYARPARPLGYRATADDTPAAIERLLRGYLAARTPEEDLRAYFARTTDDDLRAQLNGTPSPPVDPRPRARRRPPRRRRLTNPTPRAHMTPDLTTQICLFHTPAHAHAALQDLLQAGIPEPNITLVGDRGSSIDASTQTLQELNVPANDLAHLMDGIHAGGVVLSVSALSDHADRVAAIFKTHSATEIDQAIVADSMSAEALPPGIEPQPIDEDPRALGLDARMKPIDGTSL